MRVFRCPSCGHRMRFVGERCGRCYSEKPLLMAGRMYSTLFYMLVLVAGFGLLAMALIRFVG